MSLSLENPTASFDISARDVDPIETTIMHFYFNTVNQSWQSYHP
jgi:hypothetical protein